MQCSVHAPTPFIQKHGHLLLPDWSCSVTSLLIVQQQASCNLLERTHLSEIQKAKLRGQFLEIGGEIANHLHQHGYAADFFDPKTGQPVLSQRGVLWLDDVAVVRACLNYPVQCVQGCSVLLHPEWGTAVYPSILLSSATTEILEKITAAIASRAAQPTALHSI